MKETLYRVEWLRRGHFFVEYVWGFTVDHAWDVLIDKGLVLQEESKDEYEFKAIGSGELVEINAVIPAGMLPWLEPKAKRLDVEDVCSIEFPQVSSDSIGLDNLGIGLDDLDTLGEIPPLDPDALSVCLENIKK